MPLPLETLPLPSWVSRLPYRPAALPPGRRGLQALLSYIPVASRLFAVLGATAEAWPARNVPAGGSVGPGEGSGCCLASAIPLAAPFGPGEVGRFCPVRQTSKLAGGAAPERSLVPGQAWRPWPRSPPAWGRSGCSLAGIGGGCTGLMPKPARPWPTVRARLVVQIPRWRLACLQIRRRSAARLLTAAGWPPECLQLRQPHGQACVPPAGWRCGISRIRGAG